MTVQLNTDNNIKGSEELRVPLIALISDELSRFKNQITRVEVYLSDENGNKSGTNDKRCVMEARLEGRKPIAVTSKADSIERAIDGALVKLKNSLTTIMGRMKNHKSKPHK